MNSAPKAPEEATLKFLITGACGLLGAHLVAALSRGHEVFGTDRHPWWGDRPAAVIQGDLGAPGFVTDLVASVVPDVIIHCAAMVSVDACEETRALAYAGNADVTRIVAHAAPPGSLVVYVTTDGIFKGDTPFATEAQLPCPRTVYGRSKLHGEWEVQQATDNHLIVRTNFYGWSSGLKQTSAEWLYHALETGDEATLFEDFFFTPIYVVHFVERLRLLIDGGHRGIIHLCGKDRISKYEFGMRMAEVAGFPTANIRCGSIEKATLKAPRPRDMSLSCERYRGLVGRDVPSCREGLRRFIADHGRPLSVRFDA